jgi:hypothetical protein
MQTKPIFYDGSGGKQQTAGTQPSNVVIPSETRKNLGGNPYVFVK